ncbi:hypothetical protein BJ508DRAFT_416379 [Ascobolus immersus RN42]|uniref:Uncharacterized protein n=1 Tax=Ascobolus immersus RN42 TaxID=1160509 RepID=A0A3N4I293_ASCIM|nr:hypothetical protein BJ508DRAFT_416379 [Ascobolus immersus RN42]
MTAKRILSDLFLQTTDVAPKVKRYTREDADGKDENHKCDHSYESDHESQLAKEKSQELPRRRLEYGDYRVGWICPLEIEQQAALEMLDEEHERLPKQPQDSNIYTFGSIYGHNIVIAGQYQTGNAAAAVVATQMKLSFPAIKFVLLVGIGGGVPTVKVKKDLYSRCGRVRLGDVVVNEPYGDSSGAIQYDRGKALSNGVFKRTGALDSPPAVLINAVRELSIRRLKSMAKGVDPIKVNLARIDTKIMEQFRFPGAKRDLLFRADYQHVKPGSSCRSCDQSNLLSLSPPEGECDTVTDTDSGSCSDSDEEQCDRSIVAVHRGTIATGELVIKDAKLRDRLAKQYKVLCFEMEAAGILTGMPCLVIRGISDYSDSHKNDRWHGYAAATAAAYARQLFFHMAVDEVKTCLISAQLLEDGINKIRKLLENEELRNLFEWLSPLKPEHKHKDFKQRFITGTGLRLLGSVKLKRWMHGPTGSPNTGSYPPQTEDNSDTSKRDESWDPVLFCCGSPGVGKSFTCCSVIDMLEEHCVSQSRPGWFETVLYIYCDYRDRINQTPLAMLGSFVRQLISKINSSSEAASLIIATYRSHKSNPMKVLTVDLMVRLFRKAAALCNSLYICIDAFDECEEETQWELIHIVESLLEDSQASLKFFVTGRPTVRSRLDKLKTVVTYEISSTPYDIQLYIEHHLNIDAQRRPNAMNDALKGDIIKKLVSVSDGVFLLASMLLESILQGLNIYRREILLHEASSSLKATFRSAMSRLFDQRKELCELGLSVLMWMTFARRNLSKEELEVALAIEIGTTEINPKNITDIHTIIESCVGLVLYETESNTVRLFHLSAQEFLETNAGEYFPGGQRSIGERCLVFVTFSTFQIPRAPWETFDSRCREVYAELDDHFLAYAASFWGHHLGAEPLSYEESRRMADVLIRLADLAEPATEPLAILLLLEHYRTRICLNYDRARVGSRRVLSSLTLRADPQIHFGSRSFGNQSKSFLKDDSRLSYHLRIVSAVSLFRLHHVLSILIDAWRLTPPVLSSWAILSRSAREGHIETVQMLIKRGNTERPLDVAVMAGQAQITRLLIETREVDFNTRDEYGYPLIHRAVDVGNLPIVKMLLREDALDPDSLDTWCRTPLSYAAEMGDSEVMEALLGTGRVDPNSRDNVGMAPLSYAAGKLLASKDKAAHIELLLERDDINADTVDNDGDTPLSYAAQSDNRIVVQMLLESGKVDLELEPNRRALQLYPNAFSTRFSECSDLEGSEELDMSVQPRSLSNSESGSADAEGKEDL